MLKWNLKANISICRHMIIKRQMREKLKPLAHGMTFNFNKQILLTRIGSNLIYSLASYAIEYVNTMIEYQK